MTPTAINYSSRQEVVDGIEVVHLADAARGIQVSIAPSVGNLAYEFMIGGKNILWSPFQNLSGLKANPALCGVPFLAPWANRIDDDAYWVNGRRYRLNPELGNLRRDAHQRPIHGLLNFSPAWTLVSTAADSDSATATSRVDFWRHPEMLAQFPFAHTITMTHRLRDGQLEVETTLHNHSAEPMPVAIGYHPYFQLGDAPRDQWTVHLAARDHVVLNDLLIPTGERKPVGFGDPHRLQSSQLDDVFTNLVRDADGRAHFWVEGEKQRITVTYGPCYSVAVVYAPAAREFICFEPMAAVTNAFNGAHAGVYPELQSVAAGGEWKESFWITPSGF